MHWGRNSSPGRQGPAFKDRSLTAVPGPLHSELERDTQFKGRHLSIVEMTSSCDDTHLCIKLHVLNKSLVPGAWHVNQGVNHSSSPSPGLHVQEFVQKHLNIW